jgi:hypothetical protein
MAARGADGEWHEIGVVEDLEFSVEQDEWLPWGWPFRVSRRYVIDVDLEGNEQAYQTLLEIARALPVVDGKKEEE